MEPPSRSERPSGSDQGRKGKRSSKQARRDKRRAKAIAGVSQLAAERRRLEQPGSVEIFVIDQRWRRLVPHVERLARRAAAAGGGAGSIVLDNDLRVRRLNARHRGKNKPTNVLTFETPAGIAGGDIVLALETVRREALAAGRLPRHHLAHLVVHGALHLRGHDHHGVGEARRMEMQEARILHRLGVPNPWKPCALPIVGAVR